jgi:signal transduction histidine kinase
MVTSTVWLVGYVAAGIAMAAFAYLYWTKRRVDGVQYLLVAALVASIQSMLYVLLLVAPAPATTVVLWQLFTVLTFAVVFLWYLFTVAWTDRSRLASQPALAAVATPLVVGTILIVTNASPSYDGLHSLYWSSVVVVEPTSLSSPLSFEFGPVALVVSVYSSLVVLGGVGMLVEFTARPEQQLYRWRNGLLVLAAVVALVFGIGFSLLEVAYEPHALVYVLANSFVVFGLVRFGTYDVMSLPQDSLIEAIEGGVLVFTRDGTVIELNRTAEGSLGVTDDVVGKGIVAVVELADNLPSVRATEADGDHAPDDPGAVATLLDGHEFTTTVNGASRTFLVRVSELTDDGRLLGWTVISYDVTDLRQKQHELDLLKQVLSRVLRHNVRNDLSVVKANAQMLEEQADGLDAERLQTIQEKSDNLLDASEKARTVERLLDGERSRNEMDVVEMVEDAIEGVSRTFPGVGFETSLPDRCRVRAHWALGRAVENLVENAAMHNDAPDPQVVVRVDCSDDRVTVHIADNGPGIPYSELEVLERGEETALEHGSSVGLWLVDWIVDLSRGDIDFENTERGCTVTLELEHAGTGPEADDDSGLLDLGLGTAESAGDD